MLKIIAAGSAGFAFTVALYVAGVWQARRDANRLETARALRRGGEARRLNRIREAGL